MLTIEKLKAMTPGEVFAKGNVIDSPEGINVAGTGKEIKWVAVRGGIHDWAIYTDNPYMPQPDFKGVKQLGDKLHSEENIKKLVPCDSEAFKMYRH